MLFAATAMSLNIVDHLACVTNQPNVSTAQVITLQTQKQCPQWEKEKKILKIKFENNISFPDARKQYKQFYTGQTFKSAVKPGTCNKTTQTGDKNTKTEESITEYKKKTKTQENPQDKKQGKENSSHPVPALKQASLNMMRKDAKKKKKEEKDKLKQLKQQQKEERRKLFLIASTERKRRSTKSKTS